MLRTILVVLLLLIAAAVGFVYSAGKGSLGEHEGPGEPKAVRRSAETVRVSEARVSEAAAGIGVPRPKQVLFGDLHVHSTFSFDAFMISLPIAGGEGSHPPADACDFARFCSQLDFWSINDHAEGITPRHWSETVDAIRQCNDVAGDPADPDTVAFLGWEWTQVGRTPDDHYGHKNVVLAGTADDEITARPIASGGQALAARQQGPRVLGRGLLAVLSDERVRDFVTYLAERDDWPLCDADTPSPELPTDCLELAETPADLYRKLDEWDRESIVIPHGTTWGFYTPPGSTWDKQLATNDPDRQRLLEVYSGHGDSEVYRDWRAVQIDDDGNATCPEPTPNYLPSCWQAGEIIRSRCEAEGTGAAECDERAALARAHAAAARVAGHLVVPGAEAEEWLDSGQCVDCAEPAFNYRPGGSAQYLLALRDFESDGARDFRMGFMASSDNHFARPGTGYKEVHRRGFTESRGGRAGGASGPMARFIAPDPVEPTSTPVEIDINDGSRAGFQLLELERQASFFLTGGLVATHAEGRDRRAIFHALERREVYGTSGPRMLLWFDLLNPPGSRGTTRPMGSEVEMAANPIFQVRAVGSFEQLPGCPDESADALGPEELERICKGECYHPSDERRRISRIEVVRVRPQERPGEPVEPLIDDPWRTFSCEPDPAGCTVLFEDPDYAADHRDTVYYVRAFEESKPAVNAGNLRCERDEAGHCIGVDLCGGDPTDDCLGEHEPRAWSSPIWVDQPQG